MLLAIPTSVKSAEPGLENENAAARMYIDDRPLFEKTAKEWVRLYANPIPQDLLHSEMNKNIADTSSLQFELLSGMERSHEDEGSRASNPKNN